MKNDIEKNIEIVLILIGFIFFTGLWIAFTGEFVYQVFSHLSFEAGVVARWAYICLTIVKTGKMVKKAIRENAENEKALAKRI